MKVILKILTKSLAVSVTLLSLLILTGCSEHKVDTFSEWCEQISGVDLKKKYEPFWSVIFSVSFDGDAIRDDFVTFMNDLHMKKIENRAPKIAWREGTTLHLVNLSSFLMIDPEETISRWREGIEASKRYELEDRSEKCLYGTITSMFDFFYIHSMENDALGKNWTDDITKIPTERRERLGEKVL